MIYPAEISKLSYRLKIADKIIEKDYVLTWLLIGLSNTNLKDEIVFKGGTAIRKAYFKNYRYSQDLDFTLVTKSSDKEILAGFEKIYSQMSELAAIPARFNRKEEGVEGSLTFYVNY